MAESDELIRLVNEYTAVRIGVDRAGASARLVVLSDRTGDRVVLDATALEAIASLDHDQVGLLVGAFSETGTAAGGIPLPQEGQDPPNA